MEGSRLKLALAVGGALACGVLAWRLLKNPSTENSESIIQDKSYKLPETTQVAVAVKKTLPALDDESIRRKLKDLLLELELGIT